MYAGWEQIFTEPAKIWIEDAGSQVDDAATYVFTLIDDTTETITPDTTDTSSITGGFNKVKAEKQTQQLCMHDLIMEPHSIILPT